MAPKLSSLKLTIALAAIALIPRSALADALVIYSQTPYATGAVDLNYNASSGEGGGIYSLQVAIIVTGNLVIQSVSCQAASCSYRQDTSQRVVIRGGDPGGTYPELGNRDLVTLTITGSQGTVQVEAGGYADAAWDERKIDPKVLASSL